jgi:hypothetical protein
VDELSGISEGLTQNTNLQSLHIPGTLLGWAELHRFLDFSSLNESIKHITLTSSRCTHFNTATAEEADVKGVYEKLEQSSLTNVEIEPWFWDANNFSDSVSVHVVTAKNRISENLS